MRDGYPCPGNFVILLKIMKINTILKKRYSNAKIFSFFLCITLHIKGMPQMFKSLPSGNWNKVNGKWRSVKNHFKKYRNFLGKCGKRSCRFERMKNGNPVSWFYANLTVLVQ